MQDFSVTLVELHIIPFLQVLAFLWIAALLSRILTVLSMSLILLRVHSIPSLRTLMNLLKSTGLSIGPWGNCLPQGLQGTDQNPLRLVIQVISYVLVHPNTLTVSYPLSHEKCLLLSSHLQTHLSHQRSQLDQSGMTHKSMPVVPSFLVLPTAAHGSWEDMFYHVSSSPMLRSSPGHWAPPWEWGWTGMGGSGLAGPMVRSGQAGQVCGELEISPAAALLMVPGGDMGSWAMGRWGEPWECCWGMVKPGGIFRTLKKGRMRGICTGSKIWR